MHISIYWPVNKQPGNLATRSARLPGCHVAAKFWESRWNRARNRLVPYNLIPSFRHNTYRSVTLPCWPAHLLSGWILSR